MNRIIIELKSHCGSPVNQDLPLRISDIALGNGCLVNQKMDEFKNIILEVMGNEKRLKRTLKVLHKNNLPTGEIT